MRDGHHLRAVLLCDLRRFQCNTAIATVSTSSTSSSLAAATAAVAGWRNAATSNEFGCGFFELRFLRSIFPEQIYYPMAMDTYTYPTSICMCLHTLILNGHEPAQPMLLLTMKITMWMPRQPLLRFYEWTDVIRCGVCSNMSFTRIQIHTHTSWCHWRRHRRCLPLEARTPKRNGRREGERKK